MYVIAMYDINTETKAGRRRLRQIFKLMKKYLIRIQNSVFEGEITKAKFEEMKLKVKDLIDSTIDSVIFFKSRDIKWMDKDICGFQSPYDFASLEVDGKNRLIY
jgi:CRISPR-associated protein Cas2